MPALRVPAAFAVGLMVSAALAACARADDAVVLGCIEASTVGLQAPETQASWRSPSSWEWMGDLPYNPVLLEHLRQTVHLEGPTRTCAVSWRVTLHACL